MKRLWKKIILWGLLGIILFFIIDIGRYFVYPNVAALKTNPPGKTAFMEYREDSWRSQGIEKQITSEWVPISQVSPNVVKAVIIAEDDKFWSHEGFDFEAMQKALEKDIENKKFKAGGSTISQQLAKNLYLTPAKNPIRKVKEAILTWRIEQNLKKRRIIELYLNVAEWGDGLFGIETAARKYYGKRARDLNAREASVLAAALPNPMRFQPKGSSRYAARRAERIYQIMLRRGIIIREYDEVVRQKDEDVKDESKEEITEEIKEEEILDSPRGQNEVPEVQAGGESESGEEHHDTVERQEDTKNESKENVPNNLTDQKTMPNESPE
ncbi:MAG: monofunctional biosynthetic peptidoglycan transglycosylase [Smithella sp.]|jgi:monofunctional biosynthetic peptidoglycan transglycosylase